MDKPIPQLWFCEKCGTIGVVMHEPHDDVMSVAYQIRAAHLKYRPECQYRERVIVPENQTADAILCSGRDERVDRETLLDSALNEAMEILTQVVDSEDCSASVRYDAVQLLRRWQRGEFLKSNEEKS